MPKPFAAKRQKTYKQIWQIWGTQMEIFTGSWTHMQYIYCLRSTATTPNKKVLTATRKQDSRLLVLSTYLFRGKKKGEGGGSTVSQWKFSNWLSSNLVLQGGATHLSSRARYPPSKQQLWTISQLANAKHAMTPKESNLKLFHAESLRERTLDCFS